MAKSKSLVTEVKKTETNHDMPALLSSLVESPADVIILSIDIDFNYTFFNTAHKKEMKKIWGVDIELGKNLLDYIPSKEERERLNKNFKRVLKGEQFTIQEQYGDFWYELAYSPISDNNMMVKGITVFITDRTDFRKAEKTMRESEERYHSLVSNIPIVTWISDSSGKTTFISPNVKDVYGYTPEEIYKTGTKLWLGRIHNDDINTVKDAYKGLFEKDGHFDISYRIKRKDGKWIWLNDKAVTTYEKEGIKYAYGVFSDITDRKEVENELLKHRELLEELVLARTTELLETNQDLEREIAERLRAEKYLIISQNRLEYVKQIGALASSSLKLEEVLESILKGTLEASGASGGMIFLKDPETGVLTLGSSIGLSDEFVNEYKKKPVKPGEGLTGRISETGERIFISGDSSDDPRIERSVVKDEGLNSFIGVPIYAASRILGVMNILTHPPAILTEKEITLASAIGAHVGFAIRNAQHFEERMLSEKKLLDYQKELQSLTTRLSLAEEQEKRRIATELHDCISQPLALSKIKLAHLNDMATSDESRKVIAELLGLIELTIKETRTLTFELSPPILYELGLTQAIKWLIDQFRDKYGLEIILEDNEHEKQFGHNIRFFIFQAVRELLVNIVKHAHADRVNISMTNNNESLRIIIEDNGIGFPGHPPIKNGYGLFNIREKMNHINGHFEIDSNSGQGTIVTLVAPFETEQ
jgi:PAS domain S-box-containing protein